MIRFKKPRKNFALDGIINPLQENVPVLALVGHTNVGKSTLFNYLTKQNAALAANVEHLTRDRQYGYGRLVKENAYIVIDTGGLNPSNEFIQSSIQTQIDKALQDATHIGIVIDAISGITHQDRDMIDSLRKRNKPLLLIANKLDKATRREVLLDEGLALGFSKCYFVSAKYKQGGTILVNDLLTSFNLSEENVEPAKPHPTIQIAIIGRPNAGKSTLLNQILGEERHIVSSEPGTTRNSIATHYIWKKEHYTLVDTAGVRRRTKIEKGVESDSVEQSLQILQTSQIIILLIDATLGFTDQEIHLLQRIREAGRGLLLLVNKWDLIPQENKKTIQEDLKERLRFFPFVKIAYVSALQRLGVTKIFPLVKEVHNHITKKYSTTQLTRILQNAIYQNALPVVKRRTIKLRYAHPGGYYPLTIVIHGSNTQHLPANYFRYLEKFFYQQLNIVGTPLKIILKERRSN